MRDKSPLGRPTRRWKYNIKMKLQEIRWERGLDLSGSGKGQVTGFVMLVMNIRSPSNVGNFLATCWSISFSRELCSL